MNRRFVNLVLSDYENRKHRLLRLDVAKHLFYPSTAQAEAANVKQENNNGGGGGDKPPKKPTMKWPKPPRIERLRPLPEPSMRFFQFPPAEKGNYSCPPYDNAFMLLRPGRSEGTILHATKGGRTVVYDADKHAISATVPFFGAGMGREPIALSVPGEKEESLYVMRSTITSPSPPCRNNGSSGEEDCCSGGDFVVLDFNRQPLNWQPLPRPPFIKEKEHFYPPGPYFDIRSSAVVDGGRTIVVSFNERKFSVHGGAEFTYSFDTVTRQWRHAGDWKLPFAGRAEYVPELGTWIGLCSSPLYHLCSADLSSAMDDGQRAPTPQHVWDDFTLPPSEESEVVLNRRYPEYVLQRSTVWGPAEHSLVNLGSGRFCTLKVFTICRREWVGFDVSGPGLELFAVLTGVEVVRCNDGEEGGLRMVKHKSKRCPITCTQQHWLF